MAHSKTHVETQSEHTNFSIALLPSIRKLYMKMLPNISWISMTKEEENKYYRLEQRLKSIIEDPSKGITWIGQTVKRRQKKVGLLILHNVTDVEVITVCNANYPKADIKLYNVFRSAYDAVISGKIAIMDHALIKETDDYSKIDVQIISGKSGLTAFRNAATNLSIAFNVDNNLRLGLLSESEYPKNLKWALKLNGIYKIEVGGVVPIEKFLSELRIRNVVLWSVKKMNTANLLVPGYLFGENDVLLKLPREELTSEEIIIQNEYVKMLPSSKVNVTQSSQVIITIVIKLTDNEELLAIMKNEKNTCELVLIDGEIEEKIYKADEFKREIHTRVIDVKGNGGLLVTVLEMFQLETVVMGKVGLRYPIAIHRRETLDRLSAKPTMIYFTAPKGTGKTMIGRMFSEEGYRVLDSDAWGRILKIAYDGNMEYQDAIEKYFSLPYTTRAGLISFFEVEMLNIINEFGTPMLRKEREYITMFNLTYSSIIRTHPPNLVHKYIATSTKIEDDLGVIHEGEKDNLTIIFGHNYVEIRQAMGGTLIRLIPLVLSPLAIMGRIRAESYKFAELMLYSAYNQMDSHNLPGLQLGWIYKAIGRMRSVTLL